MDFQSNRQNKKIIHGTMHYSVNSSITPSFCILAQINHSYTIVLNFHNIGDTKFSYETIIHFQPWVHHFLLFISDLPNCSSKLPCQFLLMNVIQILLHKWWFATPWVFHGEFKLFFKYCITNRLSLQRLDKANY